jgi:hypothetical protein
MWELPISYLLPHQCFEYHSACVLKNLRGNLEEHIEVILNFNYDFEYLPKVSLKLHNWFL